MNAPVTVSAGDPEQFLITARTSCEEVASARALPLVAAALSGMATDARATPDARGR
ncbi:hypothetical protein [Nonomuraea sp. JJY05]|uniref:hypothetical protein n=1 Tax=Nonomuraea sp. JJY05 TaxID=3350255 RepID=UPI00373FA1C4